MEDSVKLAEQIFGATGNLSFYVPSKISSNNNEVYVKIPERLEQCSNSYEGFLFLVILVLCCFVLFYFTLKCVTVTVTVGFSREILVCLVVFFSCNINLIFLVLSKHVRIRLPSRLIFKSGFQLSQLGRLILKAPPTYLVLRITSQAFLVYQEVSLGVCLSCSIEQFWT